MHDICLHGIIDEFEQTESQGILFNMWYLNGCPKADTGISNLIICISHDID